MAIHVMLDLETWGKKPGCAIRSIGAVAFDPFDWSVWHEFYLNLSDEVGERDKSTVEWWSEQNAEAQAVFTDPALPRATTAYAVRNFVEFFKFYKGVYIWSHGAGFDVPIIEWAMDKLWVPVPWRFDNIRDTRTAYHMSGMRPSKSTGKYTVAHHALHDAARQTLCLQAAYKRLDAHEPGK